MDHADRLAPIAIELIARVRDLDPEDNGRWLRTMLPDSDDWFRLAFLLAAVAPVDRTWGELTAWAGEPPTAEAPVLIEPTHPSCGTVRGYRRHNRHQEPACTPCKAAEAARTRQRRNNSDTTTDSGLETAA